ncbi:hypothetical protein Vi05172_g1942 [Venturia inaequalis]|nr:hypothetical protein Vi05172_g1942 [Venturia inaequalis]
MSSASRGSRRGWRKHLYTDTIGVGKTAKFACVFCKIPYNPFCEWRRHEESAHVSPVGFICEGLEPMYINGQCIYCKVGERSWGIGTQRLRHHANHKRALAIRNRKRTFSRKDRLVQHIRQFHNAPKFSMDDRDQSHGPG